MDRIGGIMRKRDQFDPPRNSPWRYAAWLSAAFIVWGLLMGGAVTADASPCVNRSVAHAVENGTTVAGDSRYHVLRGELPTCGQESSSGYNGETYRDSDGGKDRDSKSRFCRKRFWC